MSREEKERQQKVRFQLSIQLNSVELSSDSVVSVNSALRKVTNKCIPR